MTTCHCDGPPHPFRPSWCGSGRGRDGRPINKLRAAAELEVRAAQLRAEASAEPEGREEADR